MPKDNPTYEEVDKHIESSKDQLQALQAAEPAKASATADAAAIPSQVCSAYKIVRPILLLILGIPFMKPSWKNAIKVFMKFMDALCP